MYYFKVQLLLDLIQSQRSMLSHCATRAARERFNTYFYTKRLMLLTP